MDHTYAHEASLAAHNLQLGGVNQVNQENCFTILCIDYYYYDYVSKCHINVESKYFDTKAE